MSMKRVVIQKARLPLAAYLFIILLFPSDNAQMQPDTLPVISPVSQAEAEANVLSADPWTFFFSSWAADAEATLRLTKNSLEAYPNPSADARVYVGDPEDRIEGEFQVPDGMRPRVMFWVDVFSRFNTRMRVIHDRNNPGLIYGYLDLRPIYRISPSTATAEFRANQIEKKVLVQLKQRISVATGITKGDADNADEYEKVKRFLSAHGALGKSEGKKLINQLRTQSGQADEFLTALQRSTLLLPHIQSVFRSQDLPVGLARIPFVESSFNARAGSKVGAMGVWQFMPQTARELIHPHEEKLWSDPLRQTKSAAVLLKRQRNSLPDWGCAITAYNAGHGRIRNLVQQYKAKDFVTLLNGPANQALGFAGQNFYAEVLAANIVEHYKVELFGWHLTGSELVRGDRWFKNKEQCDL